MSPGKSGSLGAILAAGGIGERARDSDRDPPKQFRQLGGRTVIEWPLKALRGAACNPIVVVLPEPWIGTAETLMSGPDLIFCAGGATRQDSIHNGLEHIESDIVVVQDASRPLITAELIRRVADTTSSADAVIAAVPMDETLKQAEDGRVIKTIDRSTIWKAQTPAAFRTEVLKEAHRRAKEEGFVGTDEAQLIERYGGSVQIVPGSRRNLKITWAEDFELADALLKVSE
ncbi:MAG TPA: 2-C-methyl-D-erythritol 4-phosphate cytidylyltransferase [Actinomycetota bacterium]|nr:2-C-methyl-D-erythritol 4-phosphate cytidylyltransferase [Actinomycetota bacterium]